MSRGGFSVKEEMELILLVILLFAAYLVVLRKLRGMYEESNLAVAAIVLLVVFVCAGGALIFSAKTLGGVENVLLAVLMMLAVYSLVWFMKLLSSRFAEVDKKAFALFLVYVLAILCATLFLRTGKSDTTIQTEAFSAIRTAVSGGGVEMLNHMFSNVVMFCPYGFLFAMLLPEVLNSFVYSLLAGVMLSAFVEIMQMILQAGQCDLDDILANTAGAVIGYTVYRVYYRRVKENS